MGGRTALAAVVGGGIVYVVVYVATGPHFHIDETSVSYDRGFREGTHAGDRKLNVFEILPREKWENYASILVEDEIDSLNSECDPPPVMNGPDDYEDYAAGRVAGMQMAAMTGERLRLSGPINWDCD